MSKPQAYDPQDGYKYQILWRYTRTSAYEHCDYAKDRKEMAYLLGEYQMAYGKGDFKVILLPMKYWPVWEVYDCLVAKVIGKFHWKALADKKAKQEIEVRHLLPSAIIVREA